MAFSRTLLDWFDANHRVLPWRGESDPYKIWVSEIILQQTRVAQGISYYHNFLAHFPTITALATAHEDEVLKVWQGLGYYSRARNMHAAAKSVLKDFNGTFPNHYDDIRRLKGVGDYTAAAVASIAFNLKYPAVDGNVLRFVTRYAGIFENIALPATRKQVEEWCSSRMPDDRTGTFNQAMMEMGATLCTPTNPACELCPFSVSCYASTHQQTSQLPIKEQKVHVRDRYFHYFIFLRENKTIIQQRTANDIWKGLFEFPLVEQNDGTFSADSFLTKNKIETIEKPQIIWQKKHILTHQRIFADFHVIIVKDFPQLTGNQQIIDLSAIKDFAVPRVVEEAIAKLKS